MCTYCNMGDWQFKWDPPFIPIPWPPTIPQPLGPMPQDPWDITKLQEYYDLLLRVKEMEDKLGCPCEPNKADYLALFKDRIELLQRLHTSPDDNPCI